MLAQGQPFIALRIALPRPFYVVTLEPYGELRTGPELPPGWHHTGYSEVVSYCSMVA